MTAGPDGGARSHPLDGSVQGRVDNEIYDALADTWWDPGECLHMLRSAMGPVRVPYLLEAMSTGGVLPGDRVLDLGCGGGLLAEDLAATGYQVTGIDPSQRSLATARAHAAASRLAIEYLPGVGEALPFPDRSFDAVVCCDVLEHVESVPRVVAEVGRVLRPGGVFAFDTVNRTRLANLVVIKVAQEWPAFAFMPPRIHAYDQFVKPAELRAAAARAGMDVRELAGFGIPTRALPGSAWLLHRHARGKVSTERLTSGIPFRRMRTTAVMYLGWCVRA